MLTVLITNKYLYQNVILIVLPVFLRYIYFFKKTQTKIHKAVCINIIYCIFVSTEIIEKKTSNVY